MEYWCGELCQARWHVAVGAAGIQGMLARHVEVERLALALRAVCPLDYLDDAMMEVDQRADWRPYEEALKSVADDLVTGALPASSGAAYPLVASENPQVTHTGQRGWLGRWIHRKRRTP